MGLPYSRQINAAFDQVTPLVAAGFKVLRTTRDISVLLAVIQVLTVILLSFILIALVLLVYSVNPDLDEERKTLITPLLQSLARITFWSIFRSIFSAVAVFGAASAATWHFFVAKQWVEDVEYEGNVDADRALEEVEAEEDDGGKGGKGKGKGKK